MPIKSQLKYLRIAPRKVRLVTDLIRKKRATEAQTILDFTGKRASRPLKRLLNQAIANAKENLQLDPANLFISKITVDEGPKYKRWQARARGQAYEIQKKTSHITLILDEVVKGKVRKAPAKKEAKPVEAEEKKEEKKVEARPPKPRVKPERERQKPKVAQGLRRIFRRKAF